MQIPNGRWTPEAPIRKGKNDQVKKDEMGGAFSTNGGEEECI
jgi:hypothetical protein